MPDDVAESLAERVAGNVRALMAVRRARGMQVSADIGMSQQAFSRRYQGSTPWRLDELELLAQALDVPVMHLIQDPRDKRQRSADPEPPRVDLAAAKAVARDLRKAAGTAQERNLETTRQLAAAEDLVRQLERALAEIER